MRRDQSVKVNPEALLATRHLRGQRVIMPTVDELVDLVADHLVDRARRALSRAGVFHLALSGGSTPQVLYRRLMIDPRYRLMPWSHTHLWLVDDRCVPFTDERSNFKMITELLVEHSDIPRSHVHPMPVLERGGDRKYEDDLRSHLLMPETSGRLDYVLLGMGNDAHTASLFPMTEGLAQEKRWVIFNDGESVAAPRPRMTLTYPMINSARTIVLLVTGESKHATLQRLAASPDDVQRLPVTGVKPTHEDTEMVWFLDEAAALGAKGAEPPPSGGGY